MLEIDLKGPGTDEGNVKFNDTDFRTLPHPNSCFWRKSIPLELQAVRHICVIKNCALLQSCLVIKEKPNLLLT